jgi:hypothetical protein
MTLRIERFLDGTSAAFRLSGRMRAEQLPELDAQIRDAGQRIVLDLEEFSLVEVEVVRFLGSCEARGATLLKCLPYIRDWIDKERS